MRSLKEVMRSFHKEFGICRTRYVPTGPLAQAAAVALMTGCEALRVTPQHDTESVLNGDRRTPRESSPVKGQGRIIW